MTHAARSGRDWGARIEQVKLLADEVSIPLGNSVPVDVIVAMAWPILANTAVGNCLPTHANKSETLVAGI